MSLWKTTTMLCVWDSVLQVRRTCGLSLTDAAQRYGARVILYNLYCLVHVVHSCTSCTV